MRLLFFIFLGFILFSCKSKQMEEVISKYPDGSPKVVKYFITNDLKQKVYVKETDYYPGNIKKVEGPLKDGFKHGKWCYWFRNGKKWSEGEFLYGLSNGRFFIWKEDGSRNLIANYKFGKPDGLWIFWDKNGKITRKVCIKNNKKFKEVLF